VNKKLICIFIILLISHCSFNSKSSFWNQTKIIKEERNKKQLFKTTTLANFEINEDLEIVIKSKKFKKDSFQNNLSNNNGRLNYNGALKKASKFRFSKIDKFQEFEPEIIFDKENLIFFSNKGSILKFNNQSKLLWKKNYYSKNEKKLKPILFFANDKKTLIVADNIAKLYALDINSGDLLWTKNSPAAFNSEIKIYKNYFFLIDYENILRCFSVIDGKEIWNIKTENSILKSQKKLSLVIKDDKIIFNNSIGDITAVDLFGNLIWIVPTSKNLNSSTTYFLKMSNLLINKDSVYFSTNMNEFYSLDINNGLTNWIQNVNSSLRSTIIDDIIFSVSDEGYLSIINSNTGEIIRRTDIFSDIKAKKRKKIRATGFIVGIDKIYVSLSNGKIFIVDIKSGKTISSIKIDNEHISRPFVKNEELFVIKDNGIIKIQ
jgi:outer membrane protein assembly factor BamB